MISQLAGCTLREDEEALLMQCLEKNIAPMHLAIPEKQKASMQQVWEKASLLPKQWIEAALMQYWVQDGERHGERQ